VIGNYDFGNFGGFTHKTRLLTQRAVDFEAIQFSAKPRFNPVKFKDG
jgi:hypothetical protein